MPSTSSSMTCMILAPSGYQDPPDGPETMRACRAEPTFVDFDRAGELIAQAVLVFADRFPEEAEIPVHGVAVEPGESRGLRGGEVGAEGVDNFSLFVDG